MSMFLWSCAPYFKSAISHCYNFNENWTSSSELNGVKMEGRISQSESQSDVESTISSNRVTRSASSDNVAKGGGMSAADAAKQRAARPAHISSPHRSSTLGTAAGDQNNFKSGADSPSAASLHLVEDAVYELFRNRDSGKFDVTNFLESLRAAGLRPSTDPRCRGLLAGLRDLERRAEAEGSGALYVENESNDPSTIPLFIQIYGKCKLLTEGAPASYIPQLARANPNLFAVSVCTIDGQRKSWGDSRVRFCLQSISKPFTYAVALNDLGADLVHKHVGTEPSGRLFNEICLDASSKPHNPMVNAGAIVCASLLRRESSLAERFEFMMQQYRKIAGGEYIGFSNSTFLSERETADRNFALSYYMREHGCFPPKCHLKETLDFYFQLCSIEVDCDSMAVMAATLANGGVCPISEERCLSNQSCRDTLSLMYSCGMYDYSGMFAFRLHSESRKSDPRRRQGETMEEQTMHVLFAAKSGDVNALNKLALRGFDLSQADYDGRSALHVAASDGHPDAVKFLTSKGRISRQALRATDRWGRTPLDDANHFNNTQCARLIEDALMRLGKIQDGGIE